MSAVLDVAEQPHQPSHPKKSQQQRVHLTSHALEHFRAEVRELEHVVSESLAANAAGTNSMMPLPATAQPSRGQSQWSRPVTGGYARPRCAASRQQLFSGLSSAASLPRLRMSRTASVGSLPTRQVQTTRKRPDRTVASRCAPSSRVGAELCSSASRGERLGFLKSPSAFDSAEIDNLQYEMEHIARLPRVRSLALPARTRDTYVTVLPACASLFPDVLTRCICCVCLAVCVGPHSRQAARV